MKKKIIFFDLDGTLIDHSDHSVPKGTLEAVKLLKEKGHTVVIATGRCPSLFYGVDKLVGIESYIASNGRYVYHNGEVLSLDTIDKVILERLFKKCETRGLDLAIESPTHYIAHTKNYDLCHKFSDSYQLEYPKLDSEYYKNNDILQCVLFIDNDDFVDFIDEFPELSFHVSNQYGLDVNLKGGMKEIGIKIIMDKLGFKKEDAYAFGDGFNDKGMLNVVGCGIAMGNAVDDLKKIADYVTDDISNDGVYKALKHFKLI